MTTALAEPNRSVARSQQILDRLRAIVGEGSLLFNPDEVLVYECDGFVVDKKSPDVVVFPTTTDQVVAIVKLCNEFDIPFVPRGAGTSLAGGCLPVGGGVMIVLTRMKKNSGSELPRSICHC